MEEYLQRGIAEHSDGAVCIFVEVRGSGSALGAMQRKQLHGDDITVSRPMCSSCGCE